ncbi:MAG: GNAT family N-acetyltransferase [Rhodoferax sp.]
MKRDRVEDLTKKEVKLFYRRAHFLDVPLIFQLLLEGAESGSFSEVFVTRTGICTLFSVIFRSVAMQFFQSKKSSSRYEWHIISNADRVEVGFLKVHKGLGTGRDSNLELLAICPAYRNQGLGAAVLEYIASEVPKDGHLYIHCTKYAKAMQHILKRHNLKRNTKFRVPQIEEYKSNWRKPT